MAEETEGAAGAGPQSAGIAADPTAVGIGLAAASRQEADAFLKDQRTLIADQRTLAANQNRMLHLQMEEMAKENPYKLSYLRLRRFSGWAKATFQFAIGLIALAMVSALGVMVWNAAHSEGYLIESFAVPPDLAARGLTGEVVAGRLLDRLNLVTKPPPSNINAAPAVSSSSADDITVEIPQTGITLGELYRLLRRWLGNETHVSGEVVRQDNNLVVTVRTNGRDGATWQGSEAELDTLLQKAAERVFETIRPTLYANWLMAQTPPREGEARAIRERVLADPATTPRVKASVWNNLGIVAGKAGDLRQSASLLRRAQEADPTYAVGYSNAVYNESNMSHPEAALALLPQALAVLEKHHETYTYTPGAVTDIRAGLRMQEAELRGDYVRSVAEAQVGARSGSQPYSFILAIARGRARQHDGAATAWLAEQPRPSYLAGIQGRRAIFWQSYLREAVLQHWPGVIAMAPEGEEILAEIRSPIGRELVAAVALRPWLALAKAKSGDIAGAESVIAASPADCYDCARIRGMIASQARQWGRADFWFARAMADAPSIPFAHEDWGRSLLARGDADAAIAQFTLSNRKGPHFADALQGWGEALMARNQSHLALAKFAEAEKYAPNWGRLHLKWGEALAYAGKPAEARTHFTRAATLDLTPSEKAELARQIAANR